MKREELVKKVTDESTVWDMVVIGGGATGLGVALDAALRGYSVTMFEQHDFAKCTSSRSTKLAHGGVRYLQKGDVVLVREALIERGRLKHNAPHLVKDQSFVIPNYTYFDNFLYTCGLTLYDMLSWGGLSLGRSLFISKRKTSKYLPTIKTKGLKGGVIYHDGQFDDSRLAINLAQSCVENGGCPVNHMKVSGILHDDYGNVSGVTVRDMETNILYTVNSKSVINATGVFVDDIIQMDEPSTHRLIKPSQGVHLVFEKSFLNSDYALMIPATSDGRVLFALPWHDKVVVGTTDVVRERAELEPVPMEEEIDFILKTAGLYMVRKPEKKDILSLFAGQRPLAAPKKEGKSTKEISRSHKIIVSDNNLITITGGKLTTYRRMAEDTVDKAIKLQLISPKKCVSKNFRIHGYRPDPDLSNHMYIYGSDMVSIEKMVKRDPEMAVKIHPKYKYTVAEVVWAVREEMARSVEDVLSRRVRLLFIDARAAIEAAPKVAEVMARELGYDQSWIEEQLSSFNNIADNYIIK
ncbi:MAG: glycerol-3-phosphate dehydrogenase/oxidase [Rikenellaceae bacterium]